LIFLIESILILLVLKKKYKKIKKNQIYKKKEEVEGSSWKPSNIFAYKYWSSTHTREGEGNFAK